jgi:hypothetical protein
MLWKFRMMGSGDRRVAAVAEVPLQVPIHKTSSAMAAARGFTSSPSSWWGSTVTPAFPEGLALAERVEGVEYLALDALKVFEGHVEEVAAAARGVQYTHVDRGLRWKSRTVGDGLVRLALSVEGEHGGAAASHSARIGLMIVGITRRST